MPRSVDKPQKQTPKTGEKNVRILIIGSEVAQGFITDTNSQFLASELFKAGIAVNEIRIIPDDKANIVKNLNDYLKTGDFIITTGGLGPTDDDLTVDILCELMKVKPAVSKLCSKKVEKVSQRYQTAIDDAKRDLLVKRLYRQCRYPENSKELPNPSGLAPGIFNAEYGILSLPGFPLEIRGIWPHALKEIKENLSASFLAQVFNIWGVIEAVIYETLVLPPEITYGNHSLPWGNQLFVKAESSHKKVFDEVVKNINSSFLPNILENPLKAWVEFLNTNNFTFGTVESCTGGFAAKLLTDIPGVSRVFMGSIVSYGNQIKTDLVGVSQQTLDRFGAVSSETALEMAVGGSKQLNCDLTVSVTGIAGPSGGTADKPAGTVHFGIYDRKLKTAYTTKAYFPFGRERFRNATVHFIFIALYQRYVFYADESKWLSSDQGKSFVKQTIPEPV